MFVPSPKEGTALSQTDLGRVRRALRKAGLDGVSVGELNGSLLLEGALPAWADVVRAGAVAAAHRGGFPHVVNHLDVPGLPPVEPKLPLPAGQGAGGRAAGRGGDRRRRHRLRHRPRAAPL